jgi:hypothetical protein
LVGALAAAVITLAATAAVAAGTLGGQASLPSTTGGYGHGLYAGMMNGQGRDRGHRRSAQRGGEHRARPGNDVEQPLRGDARRWGWGTGPVDSTTARGIATSWLSAHSTGTAIRSIDTYPGYFTIDLQHNGLGSGMMSVNSFTGSVWYHTWPRGAFITTEDS